MKKRVAKTTGLEWLILSISSFNGSGYADYTDVDSFINSYVAYKRWKKLPDQAQYADANREYIQEAVQTLLNRWHGGGHKPSAASLAKFEASKQPTSLTQNSLL